RRHTRSKRDWSSDVCSSDLTTRPANPGESVTAAFLCWFLGCVIIYAALFGTGYVLYGKLRPGIACLVAAGVAAWGLFRTLPRVEIGRASCRERGEVSGRGDA